MRDEPVPLHLLDEAMRLLAQALALGPSRHDKEVLQALEGLALSLPALRAQDWRQHRA